MPPERRKFVVVDVAAVEDLRVQIGPIGWVVLEALASQAPPGRGVMEVACSARSLAKVVGLSKDTVARSLAGLIGQGFVERVHHRDELSGRFTSTTYRVDLALVGITVVDARHLSARSEARPHATSSALTDDHQLSLLR